jgi:lipopolysaccharide/colanic/teichoic acid biosynthesis glycosyltransferase
MIGQCESMMTRSFYSRFGKRWFDFACSLIGIVLLVPVFLVLALLVLLTSGWPILFRQTRAGQNGKPFNILKFRTMAHQQPGSGSLLTSAGDQRITPIGTWMRRAKFDELPQLFNVLRGDMSLVGPRPEVPYFTDQFTDEQRKVLNIRPGITGPAATKYIGEEKILATQSDKEAFYVGTLLPAKLELDLAYANNLAFHTDLKIIANTFVRLVMKSPEFRKLNTDRPHGVS